MIKLYYTGATSFNTSQSLPSSSLGGYISNTTVPNGVLNSLFTPISLMELYKEKKSSEYIALGMYLYFFEEEPTYEKINLKFTLALSEDNEEEAEYFKDLNIYKAAIAPISGDSVNGYYMETITANAKPYYLTQDFKKLKFDEEVIFENVDISDKGVGLWLSRTFDPKLAKEKFGFDSEYWETNTTLPNLDFTFDLKISFEGVED